jgi:hypothetical protein
VSDSSKKTSKKDGNSDTIRFIPRVAPPEPWPSDEEIKNLNPESKKKIIQKEQSP